MRAARWAEKLRLYDQRHFQVLHNHVDAEGEHGDTPEKTVRSNMCGATCESEDTVPGKGSG